ncbi:MAG: histidine phosphatase family protein [Edaphobacter sp.]
MTGSNSPSTSPLCAKIVLVRHGQSVANAGGVSTDQLTNPLTELGHAQARAFAEAFSGSPTRFIRSTYIRARQTSEPLLQKLPMVPVEEWPIHEFTYLEPTVYQTDDQQMPRILEYWGRNDPAYIDGPSVESFSHFMGRVRDTSKRLAQAAPGEHIVVFTHGFWMQAFRLLLLFPGATDAELMPNFRRFHFAHFLSNTEALEFDALNGEICMLGQHHLSDFSLEEETTHA